MNSSPPYTVADRLAELGVPHVFGVPGDFTLGLRDHVDAPPILEAVAQAAAHANRMAA